MKPIFIQSSYKFTLIIVVMMVSLLAGLGLMVWGASPLGYLLQHDCGTVRGWHDLLFLLGWLLMCVAMMMPTALPLLAAVERLTSKRPDTRKLTLITAFGFLGVWLAAGVVMRMADISFHSLTHQISWLSVHSSQLGAVLLGMAGIYLLLPIAQNCVNACQSPMGFIAKAWTGKPNVEKQVAQIGWEYGMSCFGCCWPLMAVMCVLGMSNPVWMLSFTLLMILQKHKKYGKLVTTTSGILLLTSAGIMISGVLTPSSHSDHMHSH
jgi:predicted metal-binding membrane protein